MDRGHTEILHPCALIGQDQAICHLIGQKGWKRKWRTGWRTRLRKYTCALIGQDEAKLSPDWAEGVEEEVEDRMEDTLRIYTLVL